jgi:hypothetical protein
MILSQSIKSLTKGLWIEHWLLDLPPIFEYSEILILLKELFDVLFTDFFLIFRPDKYYKKVRLLSLYLITQAPRHENVGGSGGIAPRLYTSTLDGDEWSAFTSWPLYPRGKSPRYPLHRRLCGPQGRSGDRSMRQFSCLCQESIPAVQSVACHYTDWATRIADRYLIR